jgi:hypothetical protein
MYLRLYTASQSSVLKVVSECWPKRWHVPTTLYGVTIFSPEGCGRMLTETLVCTYDSIRRHNLQSWRLWQNVARNVDMCLRLYTMSQSSVLKFVAAHLSETLVFTYVSTPRHNLQSWSLWQYIWSKPLFVPTSASQFLGLEIVRVRFSETTYESRWHQNTEQKHRQAWNIIVSSVFNSGAGVAQAV